MEKDKARMEAETPNRAWGSGRRVSLRFLVGEGGPSEAFHRGAGMAGDLEGHSWWRHYALT